jgi:hypothetical protein
MKSRGPGFAPHPGQPLYKKNTCVCMYVTYSPIYKQWVKLLSLLDRSLQWLHFPQEILGQIFSQKNERCDFHLNLPQFQTLFLKNGSLSAWLYGESAWARGKISEMKEITQIVFFPQRQLQCRILAHFVTIFYRGRLCFNLLPWTSLFQSFCMDVF